MADFGASTKFAKRPRSNFQREHRSNQWRWYLLKLNSQFQFRFNQFQPSVAFHKETSHLICIPNKMTGFYICNTGRKWVNVNMMII